SSLLVSLICLSFLQAGSLRYLPPVPTSRGGWTAATRSLKLFKPLCVARKAWTNVETPCQGVSTIGAG
ncbi:MAG: hypothetical protein AAB332_05905, partial [Planctomycetota bacterium]